MSHTTYVLRRQLGRRWPGWWLFGLLLLSGLSTVFSVVPKESLKFTIDLALGAVLWLALPFWIVDHRETRLRWLQIGLVGGAVVSAGLGLLEFWSGLHINDWLLWPFKAGATIAGPFVRLSGTFEYANIAAMYYEMALPFALAGLISAFSLTQRKWLVTGAWLIAVGVLIEAILLTFSRAALPGLLIVGPLMLWTGRKQWRAWRTGLVLATVLGLALVGLSLLVSPTLLLRFKSESDQAWYKADFAGSLPARLPACGEYSTLVTVHNATPLDWSSDTYQLAYHWLDRPGHIYLFDGVRSELPSVVRAEQSVPVQARLVAPAQPGAYLLAWDIVQVADNTNWFSLRSASYQTTPVDITSGATTCTDPPQTLADLPTTPSNPERGQLWRVALKMIGARLWLGVGPDGYRFAYGQYASQSVWDTRIFANSTPLELAADLGLAGALCFGLFFGTCIWPLLRQGWSGRLGLTGAAVGAALVTFALHGLLDYFLGFHAIFLLLWILLALAWAERESV